MFLTAVDGSELWCQEKAFCRYEKTEKTGNLVLFLLKCFLFYYSPGACKDLQAHNQIRVQCKGQISAYVFLFLKPKAHLDCLAY